MNLLVLDEEIRLAGWTSSGNIHVCPNCNWTLAASLVFAVAILSTVSSR